MFTEAAVAVLGERGLSRTLAGEALKMSFNRFIKGIWEFVLRVCVFLRLGISRKLIGLRNGDGRRGGGITRY